jgi:hypothetical protein
MMLTFVKCQKDQCYFQHVYNLASLALRASAKLNYLRESSLCPLLSTALGCAVGQSLYCLWVDPC